MLLPLRLHPHIVLIARLRKYVCSSNACSCACGSDRPPKPLLPPLGVECLQRLLMVLSSRGPIAPWRRKKHPRKIKCSYACLRIRWHGSPCRPAVREVVRQLNVEGLRVRGPRAGFRSCAASAPGAAALPAAHASVKPAFTVVRSVPLAVQSSGQIRMLLYLRDKVR